MYCPKCKYVGVYPGEFDYVVEKYDLVKVVCEECGFIFYVEPESVR